MARKVNTRVANEILARKSRRKKRKGRMDLGRAGPKMRRPGATLALRRKSENKKYI